MLFASVHDAPPSHRWQTVLFPRVTFNEHTVHSVSWEEREGSRLRHGDGRDWWNEGGYFFIYLLRFLLPPWPQRHGPRARAQNLCSLLQTQPRRTCGWIRPFQIKGPTSPVIASPVLIAAVDMDYIEWFFYLPVADLGGLPIHSHCTQVNISLTGTPITLTRCSHTWGGGSSHVLAVKWVMAQLWT